MALPNWALVVGIDHYPVIGDLHGAERDAQDFYNWVIDPGGGGVDPTVPAGGVQRARLILSRPGAQAKDAEPARHQIEAFFRDVDDAANQNDGIHTGKRLYMYFSGHGFSPSFDRSAVLPANTTRTALDNVACRLWADRLFEGGWFDEVLLFQDSCRNRLVAGTLMPPFLAQRNAPGTARFYALAAPDGKLALEKPDANGDWHGVFTMTLMEGLRGHARDPATGAITSAGLMGYLQNNMRAKYTDAERQNDDYAEIPDVYAPVPFDIVPAPTGGAAPSKFPVRATLAAGNLPAVILDDKFATIARNDTDLTWDLTLPVGFYRLLGGGGLDRNFKVTGAFRVDGSAEVVNV